MQRRLYVANAGLIPLRLWRYKIAAAQSDRGFFAACLARHRTFNNLCPPKDAAEKTVGAVILSLDSRTQAICDSRKWTRQAYDEFIESKQLTRPLSGEEPQATKNLVFP